MKHGLSAPKPSVDQAVRRLTDHTYRLIAAILNDARLPFRAASVPNRIVVTFAPGAPISQRIAHYSPGRWTAEGSDDAAPEINIDPDKALPVGPVDFVATILHELAHHAQHVKPTVFGKPAKPPTHNREWHKLCNDLLGIETAGKKGFTKTPAGSEELWRKRYPWIFDDPMPWRIGARTKKKGKMRLWVCECEPPVKLRVGRTTINATCNDCGAKFVLDESET